MRLIVLAAGRGTRLGALTENTPKALLPFSDGTTILEKQIENAINAGIDDINIVTGFRAKQIEAKIKHWQELIPISTTYSSIFKTTNSIVSAWMTRTNMTEDFILTDSDNVYKHGLIRNIIRQPRPDSINLVVSPKPSYDSEDMGVKISGDKVLCMSKQVPLDRVDANCVGLAIVKGQHNRQLFVNKLSEIVAFQPNDYWEEVLNSLIDDGVHVEHISIDDDDWIEVDTAEDYRKAEFVFSRSTSGESENRPVHSGTD